MSFPSPRWLLLTSLAISACHPVPQSGNALAPREPIRIAKTADALPAAVPALTPPRASPSPVCPPRFFRDEAFGISFQGVTFDSRSHRLAIADQTDGPASIWNDSREAGLACHALAAVNGGFFTPEGRPLGRVITYGKSIGSWNPSSLGSGTWCEQTNGSSAIIRREDAKLIPGSGISSLLQAGPMLVENGRQVKGLDQVKSSPRTLLAWDGGTRWIIAHTDPCTLSGLSTALAAKRIAAIPVRSALNLDGGRSSELWISPAIPGGPVFFHPFWNRPVRNFVLLLPR